MAEIVPGTAILVVVLGNCLALASEPLKSVAIIMLGQGMRPATRSILSGTDVTILQKILGHSEIGMTTRYVKIAEHY